MGFWRGYVSVCLDHGLHGFWIKITHSPLLPIAHSTIFLKSGLPLP